MALCGRVALWCALMFSRPALLMDMWQHVLHLNSSWVPECGLLFDGYLLSTGHACASATPAPEQQLGHCMWHCRLSAYLLAVLLRGTAHGYFSAFTEQQLGSP